MMLKSDPNVDTWYFMCGPMSLNVFILGIAWNLYVFKRNGMNIEKVLDMRRSEVPTPGGVFAFGFLLLFLQFLIYAAEELRRGQSFGYDEIRMEMLLVIYCFFTTMLMICPFDILHQRFRYFVLRKIGCCFWPFQSFRFHLPTHATPFIEVLLADGLTSLSKFFQDGTVALLLLSFPVESPSDALFLKTAYTTKMKDALLPYLAASIPFIIRATQCLISFYRTTNNNDRFLHLLNTVKYCSSLLVIFVGAYPQLRGTESGGASTNNSSLFLCVAAFNSLYSFLWDVIMDWGLGQPGLPSRIIGLRHQLQYSPTFIYYIVIVVDFCLRILWVTKWWDWASYGVHFKLLSQVAEVMRRVIWNNLRVEWQLVRFDILGKKIGDIEETYTIENTQLLSDDDDDESSTERTSMLKDDIDTKSSHSESKEEEDDDHFDRLDRETYMSPLDKVDHLENGFNSTGLTERK